MARKNQRKGLWNMDHEDWGGHGGYGYHHNNNYKPAITVKRGWNTGDEPKVCTDCSYTPKDKKQTIFIEYDTWKVLLSVCAKVKLEWQALLKGTIEDNGDVVITGYYIPKQEITSSTVKNLDVIDDEFISTNNIVAGIHSHANMACFFSSTDHEHTNMSLIKHNIVINNKSEYKAQSRIELPCGLVKFIDAEVYTIGSPDMEVVGLANIQEKKFGFQGYNGWSNESKKVEDAKTEVVTPTNTTGLDGTSPRYNGHITDGQRWCPVCSMMPEEDSGYCTCWTKGFRPMLPDFTMENYVRVVSWGKSWELKPDIAAKYIDPPAGM